MPRRILAPLALAAACAAAALTVTPRPALALGDTPLLSSGDDGSGSADCPNGRTVECGSTTVYRCLEWIPQITVGATGVGVTYVCAKSVTQVSKSYKD